MSGEQIMRLQCCFASFDGAEHGPRAVHLRHRGLCCTLGGVLSHAQALQLRQVPHAAALPQLQQRLGHLQMESSHFTEATALQTAAMIAATRAWTSSKAWMYAWQSGPIWSLHLHSTASGKVLVVMVMQDPTILGESSSSSTLKSLLMISSMSTSRSSA
jgi:hypothetical protein